MTGIPVTDPPGKRGPLVGTPPPFLGPAKHLNGAIWLEPRPFYSGLGHPFKHDWIRS